jgi:PBP1b-binding outer membrane lipoprotein LpoB
MRVTLVAALLVALSGCSSAVSDMVNNRFLDVVPQSVTTESGNWTGSMGPYISTLAISADGNGELCYSYVTANVVQAIKVSGGSIYVQDGTSMAITSSTTKELVAVSTYGKDQTFTFRNDQELTLASSYCKQALK